MPGWKLQFERADTGHTARVNVFTFGRHKGNVREMHRKMLLLYFGIGYTPRGLFPPLHHNTKAQTCKCGCVLQASPVVTVFYQSQTKEKRLTTA